MLLFGTLCFLSLLHSDLLKPAIVAVVDPTARYSAHAACAGHSEACLDDDKRNIKGYAPLITVVVEWIFVS